MRSSRKSRSKYLSSSSNGNLRCGLGHCFPQLGQPTFDLAQLFIKDNWHPCSAISLVRLDSPRASDCAIWLRLLLDRSTLGNRDFGEIFSTNRSRTADSSGRHRFVFL